MSCLDSLRDALLQDCALGFDHGKWRVWEIDYGDIDEVASGDTPEEAIASALGAKRLQEEARLARVKEYREKVASGEWKPVPMTMTVASIYNGDPLAVRAKDVQEPYQPLHYR